MPKPITKSVRIPGTRRAVGVQSSGPLTELEWREFMFELERRKSDFVEDPELEAAKHAHGMHPEARQSAAKAIRDWEMENSIRTPRGQP